MTTEMPVPAAPAVIPHTIEQAYRAGVDYARRNNHPSYEAAVAEYKARHGERSLIGFEVGYYNYSIGEA